ncbi:MAG: ATP synthase F0 subunit B [bacterium]
MTVPINIRRMAAAAILGMAGLSGALWAPGPLWAAVPKDPLAQWVHSFNFGSGALILNPVIILIQWANFLVLLIILNKVLYKPLWRHIDARNGKIEGDLASAERDQGEAQGYVNQYEDSLAEIQRENTEALLALQQEMAESGRQKMDEIRQKTAHEMDEARASISSQAEQAASQLESRAGEFASQIANRLAGRQIA